MAFDLSTLALSTGSFDLQLKHPATDELLFADAEKTLPVTISLFGTASKQWLDDSTAKQNGYIKRGKKLLNPEEVMAGLVETYTAISEKTANLDYQGRPVEGPDMFRALYSDPQYAWLKNQVDAAIGEVSNFLAH
jgi:hypothetical protein